MKQCRKNFGPRDWSTHTHTEWQTERNMVQNVSKHIKLLPFSRLSAQLQNSSKWISSRVCLYRFSWFLFWHNQICTHFTGLYGLACKFATRVYWIVYVQAFIRLASCGWKMPSQRADHSYGFESVLHSPKKKQHRTNRLLSESLHRKAARQQRCRFAFVVCFSDPRI